MAFSKGEGGRIKGVPNKVTTEVRQLAAALVDDPAYRQRLLRDLRSRKIAPAIEQMLWYYAKGKPRETIEVTGALTVAQMTDAELKARVFELAQKLG